MKRSVTITIQAEVGDHVPFAGRIVPDVLRQHADDLENPDHEAGQEQAGEMTYIVGKVLPVSLQWGAHDE